MGRTVARFFYRGKSGDSAILAEVSVGLDSGRSPDKREADRISTGAAGGKPLAFLQGHLVGFPVPIVLDLINACLRSSGPWL